MFKLRNLIIFLGLNNCSCFVSRNSATSHYRKTKSNLITQILKIIIGRGGSPIGK